MPRMMTVDDMIAALEDISAAGLGGAELRVATQPGWPLQAHVAGVVAGPVLRADVLRHAAATGEPMDTRDLDTSVWIVEGRQCSNPYAPRGVFEAVV